MLWNHKSEITIEFISPVQTNQQIINSCLVENQSELKSFMVTHSENGFGTNLNEAAVSPKTVSSTIAAATTNEEDVSSLNMLMQISTPLHTVEKVDIENSSDSHLSALDILQSVKKNACGGLLKRKHFEKNFTCGELFKRKHFEKIFACGGLIKRRYLFKQKTPVAGYLKGGI